MKVIILGAGHVGSSVARSLANEGYDVVVIDINPERLRELQDRVDIATVAGFGTFPDTLERANIQEADLLIAVMPRDEDNMTACQIAWALYHPPLIIARIRNIHYLAYPEIFTNNNIHVDELISPESLVTDYVQRLIEYPGVRQLHDFNNGALKLVSLNIQTNSPAMNKPLREIHAAMPDIRCVAIFRDNKLLTADNDILIASGDRLLYTIPSTQLLESINLFQQGSKPYKRIIIAGGGHVGKRLAIALQENFKVKIIEKDDKRARSIAEQLEKTIVLSGDATDPDLLKDEGISDSDVFCALTSSDEANILSSMMAKKLKVRETICLVNKTTYMDMILSSTIDTVFSPERITSANILRYVRKGGVVNVCPIHGSSLEVLEIIVEGNQETSRVVGLQCDQLTLPEGVSINVIIRGEQLLELRDNPVIETRDHLILVVPIKQIAAIQNYFQVTTV